MTVGKTLKRSFLVGYGASAGHSAWRGTKDNILAILAVALALTVVAGPLYFVYKLGKALLERPEDGESRVARIFWFGLGAGASAMYLGWVLFMASALVTGTGAAQYVPGAKIVPGQVTEAVIANAENSMARTARLFGGGQGEQDGKPRDRSAPGNTGVELAGSLAARAYLLIFCAGLAAGFSQRRQSGAFEDMMRHNMAFFEQNGLDLSDDGILTDADGQTYRIEERAPQRITLMALHRRNLRGYIDFDAGGRATRWSGLVRRGQA